MPQWISSILKSAGSMAPGVPSNNDLTKSMRFFTPGGTRWLARTLFWISRIEELYGVGPTVWRFHSRDTQEEGPLVFNQPSETMTLAELDTAITALLKDKSWFYVGKVIKAARGAADRLRDKIYNFGHLDDGGAAAWQYGAAQRSSISWATGSHTGLAPGIVGGQADVALPTSGVAQLGGAAWDFQGTAPHPGDSEWHVPIDRLEPGGGGWNEGLCERLQRGGGTSEGANLYPPDGMIEGEICGNHHPIGTFALGIGAGFTNVSQAGWLEADFQAVKAGAMAGPVKHHWLLTNTPPFPSSPMPIAPRYSWGGRGYIGHGKSETGGKFAAYPTVPFFTVYPKNPYWRSGGGMSYRSVAMSNRTDSGGTNYLPTRILSWSAGPVVRFGHRADIGKDIYQGSMLKAQQLTHIAGRDVEIWAKLTASGSLKPHSNPLSHLLNGISLPTTSDVKIMFGFGRSVDDENAVLKALNGSYTSLVQMLDLPADSIVRSYAGDVNVTDQFAGAMFEEGPLYFASYFLPPEDPYMPTGYHSSNPFSPVIFQRSTEMWLGAGASVTFERRVPGYPSLTAPLATFPTDFYSPGTVP